MISNSKDFALLEPAAIAVTSCTVAIGTFTVGALMIDVAVIKSPELQTHHQRTIMKGSRLDDEPNCNATIERRRT